MSPQEETQHQYSGWEFNNHIQTLAYQLDYEAVDVWLAPLVGVFMTGTINEVLFMTTTYRPMLHTAPLPPCIICISDPHLHPNLDYPH
jgi:hypothetical protein